MEHQNTKTSLVSNVLILCFFIILGLGAGWLHLSFQPQQWQVTAKFAPPKAVELGNFYALKSTYQQIQNDGTPTPNAAQEIADTAFAEFKKQITALDSRLDFLSAHNIVQQIAQVNYQSTAVLARQLAETLQFDPTTDSLSFRLVNPEQAGTVLNDFIQHSTVQVRGHLNAELIEQWKLLFQQVKQSAEANLGEQWQAKLNLMRSVQALDDKLMPYHLVQKPIVADKPSLSPHFATVLALCAILGALLGIFVIVLRRK